MSRLDMTMGARIASIVLLILVLLVGSGNLWATYFEVNSFKLQLQHQQAQQQAAQKAASVAVEKKICGAFASIASLKPPSIGPNPSANPSRAYDSKLHDRLVALGTTIGCSDS